MSDQVYRTEKISEDLYVITETESVHCYLILGDRAAILFDTGYGYESLEPYVRAITNLPLSVVLSHGDPDHGLGSSWFPEVYLHELDCGKLLRNDTREMRRKALDYRLAKMPELRGKIRGEQYLNRTLGKTGFRFLKEGDRLELGGKDLEVIHTPGHSYGHIMLLDWANKRLFSGDQVTAHNVWYFFSEDEQAPFIMARRSMEKLWKEKADIRDIYAAHGRYPISTDYIDDQLECLRREIKENFKEDQPFCSFMGNGLQHRYKTVNMIYSMDRLKKELENGT